MSDMELAIEIINIKIAKVAKENTNKNYSEFNKEINLLKKEKEKIYLNDRKIIDKVIKTYGNDVKTN